MPPVLVAAAVLIEGGRVLLTRRPAGTHLENLWEFPGGKLEEGEPPQEALARELREECGLEVRVGAPVEVTFWRYPKRDVLLLFFRVFRQPGCGPVQHLGVADHAWVPAEELEEYPLPPADVPVLEAVRALLAAARATES